jgi:hypothetical protein
MRVEATPPEIPAKRRSICAEDGRRIGNFLLKLLVIAPNFEDISEDASCFAAADVEVAVAAIFFFFVSFSRVQKMVEEGISPPRRTEKKEKVPTKRTWFGGCD